MKCDHCIVEDAEWTCPNCGNDSCDSCIESTGGDCPECEIDPGWEEIA